ncbi:hypothetical protein RFI_34685, partial [Reticulomyxa filosa]
NSASTQRLIDSVKTDIEQWLKDENLFVGYRKAKCELFDPFRSRPRRHFKQCKKCHRLNHDAKDCIKKKPICKFCGLSNHSSADCKHKNNPKKYRCVLCRGNHASDSIVCEVIRKIREKIGIKITRKEKAKLKSKKKVSYKAQNKEINNNQRNNKDKQQKNVGATLCKEKVQQRSKE